MEISVTKSTTIGQKPRPKDSELGFGKYFTDHMFLVDYDEGKGWHDPRIVPYGPLSLDPAALVLHYAQEVFEGLKAYHLADGGVGLFRPDRNIARMNKSAVRMVMPEMDPDLFMRGMKELILLDRNWIPTSPGTSLYIRPTMIATEPHVGVKVSAKYLFYIIIGPVSAYYASGFNPTKIYVSEKFVRAAKGGVGEAKTSGNYGSSLYASSLAAKEGCNQVLWLDAKEHRWVEEVGTSNIFFRLGDELITPPLGGTILPGVTRDSVFHLAKDWGIKAQERAISIEEVIGACKDKTMKEVFATGTAAVISPVGELIYKGESIPVASGKTGELSQKLYDELTAIQYGRKDDPYGWRMKLA